MSTAQAQAHNKDDKKNGNPVVATAAAAAKPADKAATSGDADKKAAATPGDAQNPGTSEEEKAKRESAKIYVVIGEVKEFKNAKEALDFLNKDPAAPKDFTAIKGHKMEKKQATVLL